eukprot:Gregarina_sp_Poly_1__2909@NODE_1811_length_3283_cov_272_758706_g1_i3_p1_GENE_NODE_1811_length_3283_cov_272_758706_g1_i3NODE_1811_length_3283_cov_272_758706_g1_i3_p1_ORF_typecomplete_len630_score79_80DEAD/PF00270_29/3_5e42DEAD/PF00270_29/6_6e02Helicase_C/PF00271_31/2_6e02Helicase_C/PF00271_31/2e21ResIII/PF04851_15/1_6e10ResIII/PF04851_15/1_2e02ERCC3_RAD25_C/PF16203_5/3_2e06AAA_19/PF13245_6/9_3e05SWI2_SNF2/PF18766_1/0_0038Flavi_DEAD/PF07652_14/0_012SNF2_N/PF00176_23/0_01SecA_DEAD/PF07517_14/0_029H
MNMVCNRLVDFFLSPMKSSKRRWQDIEFDRDLTREGLVSLEIFETTKTPGLCDESLPKKPRRHGLIDAFVRERKGIIPKSKKVNLESGDESTAKPEGSTDDIPEDWKNWRATTLSGITEVEKAQIVECARAFTLHPTLSSSLQKQGWSSPTEVQARTCPIAVIKRHDMIVASETGSGKTAAFAIPIIQQMLTRDHRNSLEALVLVPSHELANQVHQVFSALAQGSNITAVCLIGGISIQKQTRLLNRQPQIVIGTIGRVSAFVWGDTKSNIWPHDHLQNFSPLRFFVLDEADRLLEWGKVREVRNFFDKLKEDKSTGRCQFFVASATLLMNQPNRDTPAHLNFIPFDGKKTTIVNLSGRENNNSKSDVGGVLKLPDGLRLTYMTANKQEKDACAVLLLAEKLRHQESPFKIIIFANAIDYVQRLSKVLRLMFSDGAKADKTELSLIALHSRKSQKNRYSVIESLGKASVSTVLIATDVAARGLDIPAVDMIVHLQVPKTSQLFVHRCGRTARGINRSGDSLLIISPDELSEYKAIFRSLGRHFAQVEKSTIWSQIQLERIKGCVSMASAIEQEEFKAGKLKEEMSWTQKMCEEAEIIYETPNHEKDESSHHARLEYLKNRLAREVKQIL